MKILITGAAKRIGRMLSEHLAEKGHRIAIHFNSSSTDAENLLNQLGGEAKGHCTIQANLGDLNEAESLISRVIDKWGKPDILINNASTYFRRGMTDFSTDELMEDYIVNFLSPFILMREFKQQCGAGSIINFVDRRVNCIDPEAGPYALAKKSLRDATEACAAEWAPEIRVNAIAPGPVLLPGEDPDNAERKDLLDKLQQIVDALLNGSETGLVHVIE